MVPFVLVVLLWTQVQLGALRVLGRLPGAWGEVAVVVVWLASAFGAWALVTGRLRRALPDRVLSSPWPSAVLVAAVAVVAVAVYPAVDDRRSTGAGSDADDAVVLVVDQIADGRDPFARDTYLANAPTTGPGSVLWAFPWPGRDAYGVAVVPALGLSLLALRRWCGGWAVPSVTALVLAASVPFWEGIAQGTDHLAMACGLAVLAVGVGQVHRTSWAVPAFAVLAAVVATWRAAYLHVPVLLAIAVWRRSRRDAAVLALVGTGLALALHGVLLSWTDGWDAYDPVQQLVLKSDEDLGAAGRAVGVLATAAGAAVVVAEARRPRPDPAVLALAGVGAPLAGIAIGGLLEAGESAAAWSEASYLLPTLVLASVVAARAVVESPAP